MATRCLQAWCSAPARIESLVNSRSLFTPSANDCCWRILSVEPMPASPPTAGFVRPSRQRPNDLFGFLTTEANTIMALIQSSAMPATLTTPAEVDRWRAAEAPDALALQRPLPDDALRDGARGDRSDGARTCCSAWGRDADRRSKPLRLINMAGLKRRACLQASLKNNTLQLRPPPLRPLSQ